MLKNIVQFECQIAERSYRFFCDNDSPLTDLKEALCQFMKHAGNLEDRARQMQEEQSNENTDIDPEIEKVE